MPSTTDAPERGTPVPTADEPSLPPRWFIRVFWQVHRALVRLTGARLGLWRPGRRGWGALRLTTTGRRTGQQRSVIVGYIEDGPNLVTMAMNGWGASDPAWWRNLQAHPEARVDLVDGPRDVVGRPAEGEDRERLWARWATIDHDLDAFAARRPRETAVVVLEPRAGDDDQAARPAPGGHPDRASSGAAAEEAIGASGARRTPPPWLNRLVAGMLRTPGLQRLVGRGTALVTFTGRRSGRTFTTPVSYARHGRRVVIIAHRSRTWWRNLHERPEIVLRLVGRDHAGVASVRTGDDPQAIDLLRGYFRQQRMTARASGVRRDEDGAFHEADLRRVLDESVVVDVRLAKA